MCTGLDLHPPLLVQILRKTFIKDFHEKPDRAPASAFIIVLRS